jgi:hypothetical protein
MKTLSKTLLISSLCLLTALPVYAHDAGRHAGIKDRMERQHARIEQGIDSGELTRKEVKVLKRQQREVRHLARDFRDDDRLCKKERRKLHRQLDQVSDLIWKFKHNERTRYDKPGYRYGYNWRDEHGWSGHHHGHYW